MRPSLLCFSLALGLTSSLTPRSSAPQMQPVSQSLYDLFVRYTNFTSASVYQPCPVPPYGATVVALINQTSTDTQASVFRDDSRQQVILSIPGTATVRDDFTDISFLLVPFVSPGISCAVCAVHIGFLSAWNSIAAQVQSALNQTLASHPSYKVIVTGHSLGAAIAQLAYASLKGQQFPVVAAYTMGQPRIGNAAYANYIDTLSGATDTNPGDYFRITHAADPIPQIPPQLVLYRHSRTEYWEAGTLAQNATSTYRCIGQEPANCNMGHQNLVEADQDQDHQRYSSIFIPDPKSCGL